MIRFTTVLGMTALVASARVAWAQGVGDTLAVRLRTGTISLAGTSNLRSFSCRSSAIEAQIAVDQDTATGPGAAVAPRIRVSVTVPVTSLDCGIGGITRDMFRTLRGSEFPNITYRLVSYGVVDAAVPSADSVLVTTQGTLTVAGKDKAVEMLVTGRRTADGRLTATGSVVVTMTDFGIAPPRLFFGTLRVGNTITVRFDLVADGPGVHGP